MADIAATLRENRALVREDGGTTRKKLTKAERTEMEEHHARIRERNEWLRRHIEARRKREGRPNEPR